MQGLAVVTSGDVDTLSIVNSNATSLTNNFVVGG